MLEVGANGKMNEFSAVMGLCNLNHIEETFLDRKRWYEYYMENLVNIQGISFLHKNEKGTNNYAYFPILIEDDYGKTRNELYSELRKHNIYARKYFYPITADQKCYRNEFARDTLQNARELASRVLTLPLYEGMGIETVDRILDILKNFKIDVR